MGGEEREFWESFRVSHLFIYVWLEAFKKPFRDNGGYARPSAAARVMYCVNRLTTTKNF